MEQIQNSAVKGVPATVTDAPESERGSEDLNEEIGANQEAINNILNGAEDEYERILGVSRAADEATKRKAYLMRALLVHPDRNANNSQAKIAHQWLTQAHDNIDKPVNSPTLDPGAPSFAASAYKDDEHDKPDNDPNPDVAGNEIFVRREAPQDIQTIYNDVDPYIKKLLLEDPSDEAARQAIKGAEGRIVKYYQDPSNHVDLIEQFRLDSGLIFSCAERRLAHQYEFLHPKKDLKLPHDHMIWKMNEEKKQKAEAYENVKTLLQKQGNWNGWPEDWQIGDMVQTEKAQSPPPSPSLRSLYLTASEYIEVLKRDPENMEALQGIYNINEKIRAQLHENDMDTGQGEIQIGIILSRYREINPYLSRLKQTPTDVDALRKADCINDEIKDIIVEHGYPETWAMFIPPYTELSGGGVGDTSTTPAGPPVQRQAGGRLQTAGPSLSNPVTRDGEPICGHREWKIGEKDGEPIRAYLFAVLPDESVPIGELRSGTRLGETAKKAYFGSSVVNEVRRHEEMDKEKWQELLAVFVHTTSARKVPEAWLMPLLADGSGTQTPLMTRTEYRKLRNGVDAEYDIAQFYEKYGLTPPKYMIPKLPPRGPIQARRHERDKRGGTENVNTRRALETAADVEDRRYQPGNTGALDNYIQQLRQRGEISQGKQPKQSTMNNRKPRHQDPPPPKAVADVEDQQPPQDYTMALDNVIQQLRQRGEISRGKRPVQNTVVNEQKRRSSRQTGDQSRSGLFNNTSSTPAVPPVQGGLFGHGQPLRQTIQNPGSFNNITAAERNREIEELRSRLAYLTAGGAVAE
ncbi:hypothetical protein EYZ11_010860 [Aspergillus tanneri]|uniref:J domain-containing protein n=1 Tax=Aspergillus tanneri TaxID=1220188 RepID=A0A4S3J4L2_9EURO|nr:uncharacterized protein ATNIH1004_001870 [Aspergillus tanneri]KAA8641405.1 hypothetical protein ATNIH1004_001870 [Aspergillus tanneri]THC89695.1 hypothetical protein EYZ11_010860 [Aspergillus tanneri]